VPRIGQDQQNESATGEARGGQTKTEGGVRRLRATRDKARTGQTCLGGRLAAKQNGHQRQGNVQSGEAWPEEPPLFAEHCGWFERITQWAKLVKQRSKRWLLYQLLREHLRLSLGGRHLDLISSPLRDLTPHAAFAASQQINSRKNVPRRTIKLSECFKSLRGTIKIARRASKTPRSATERRFRWCSSKAGNNFDKERVPITRFQLKTLLKSTRNDTRRKTNLLCLCRQQPFSFLPGSTRAYQ